MSNSDIKLLDGFVIIKSFSLAADAFDLCAQLESEGITCYVDDEFITKTGATTYYVDSKLCVKESDFEKALELLGKYGYTPDHEPIISRAYNSFTRSTSFLPFLKSFQPVIRLLIVFGTVASLFIAVIYFATLPTTIAKLTKNAWCVDSVIYNGKNYIPKSKKIFKIDNSRECEENIVFFENGRISLPGFNSFAVDGIWQITNHSLNVTKADSFGIIYNGVYNLGVSGNELIIKSPTTTIHCYAQE